MLAYKLKNFHNMEQQNSDDLSQFVTNNDFNVLDNETLSQNGGSWSTAAREKKRHRANTGSNSEYELSKTLSDYENLSLDNKLSMLFQEMKGVSSKVDSCLNLQIKVNSIETTMSDHERRIKLLEYKSVDLESRCRRNNLLISGIPEERDENCFHKISTFLREKLEIDPCPPIPRCHRLGKFRHGSSRPIIIYCLDFRDTEFILSNARKLRGTHFHINRDFPREIVDARKILWPQYKRLRQEHPNSKVSIVYPAKIIQDGRVVADAFPNWDTIMQGSRVTSHKLLFTNTQYASASNVNKPNTQPAISRVPRAQSVNSNKAVSQDRSQRNQSPVLEHRTPRKQQSPSPSRRRNPRPHAPRREIPHRHQETAQQISSSQPQPMIQRPWDTPGSRNTPNPGRAR